MIRPTEAQWNEFAKTAKRAAQRFAVTYRALNWKWSAGMPTPGASISYVPDEARILTQLCGMLNDLRGKVEKLSEWPECEPVCSYGTGGLHAEASMELDSVALSFVFTDAVNLYLDAPEVVS